MNTEHVILSDLNKYSASNFDKEFSRHFENDIENIIMPELMNAKGFIHEVVFAKKESDSSLKMSNILNQNISNIESQKNNSSRFEAIEERISTIRENYKDKNKENKKQTSIDKEKKRSSDNKSIHISNKLDQKISSISQKINQISIANTSKSTYNNSKLNDSNVSCFSWCGSTSTKK